MNTIGITMSPSVASSQKKRRPKSLQQHQLQGQYQKRRTSNIIAETVWTKFKNQLTGLMERLGETQTRYIRCIKPNSQKKALLMEHTSTIEQLRCAGVVAAVTISRSAFPNRLEHVVVLERFKSMRPKGDHNTILQDMSLDVMERQAKATEVLLTLALKDMQTTKPDGSAGTLRAFVMGRTRAYFRAGALEFLEGERIKLLGSYATRFQTLVRSWVQRCKYLRFHKATIRLQSGLRRHLAKTSYKKLRSSSVVVQCWYRVLFASRTIFHLRRSVQAAKIQTQWRIRRDQQRYRTTLGAILIVQTAIRGAIQRPKYRKALTERKEEAKLENQLVELQRKLEEAEAKREQAERNAEARANAAFQEQQRQHDEAELQANLLEESKIKEEKERLLVEPERTILDDEAVRLALEESERAADLEREIQLQEEQQRLMDESGRMLEYLRKEVFKLRTQNQQLKRDFDLLKDNNQRLMDANASAGASFAALNQHAKQMSKQNSQLIKEVEYLKAQNHKINIVQVELKDELKMKQASYVAEVQSRLQYQKSLQKVTDMIQEKCRDHRLVERVLQVADECEMELIHHDDGHRMVATSEEPDLDDDEMDGTDMNSSRGLLGFFFR
jgi:myosin V